jgi:hypothetical protein
MEKYLTNEKIAEIASQFSRKTEEVEITDELLSLLESKTPYVTANSLHIYEERYIIGTDIFAVFYQIGDQGKPNKIASIERFLK